MNATPSNKCSTGPLVIANSDDGVAIFTGYDLEPGEVRVGKVKIRNTGPAAARFRLFEIDPSSGFAPGELTVTVIEDDDDEPVPLYRGDLGGISADGINLGVFTPNEERTYRFLARLDADGSNPTRDRGAGAAYEWRATHAIPWLQPDSSQSRT